MSLFDIEILFCAVMKDLGKSLDPMVRKEAKKLEK